MNTTRDYRFQIPKCLTNQRVRRPMRQTEIPSTTTDEKNFVVEARTTKEHVDELLKLAKMGRKITLVEVMQLAIEVEALRKELDTEADAFKEGMWYGQDYERFRRRMFEWDPQPEWLPVETDEEDREAVQAAALAHYRSR